MEVCAASVQGAVVPGSEYAFAALTCCVLSVSSLCVLPDFALKLPNEPSVSRHTSNLSSTRSCSHYSAYSSVSGLQLRFAFVF